MSLKKWADYLYRPRLWQPVFYTTAGYILYLATLARHYPIPHSNIDKVNHFAAFVVLTLLLMLAHPRLRARHIMLWLVGFGVAIECIQYVIPYRDFSLLDVLADTLGIGFGLLLTQRWRRAPSLPEPATIVAKSIRRQ